MNVVLIAIGCGLLAVLYGIITSHAGAERARRQRADAGHRRAPSRKAPRPISSRQYTHDRDRRRGRRGRSSSISSAPISAVGFVIGAILSGADRLRRHEHLGAANVRTAEAARTSLQGGLTMAFRAGAITGMLVAGLGLLAISGFFWYLIGVRRPRAQRPRSSSTRSSRWPSAPR